MSEKDKITSYKEYEECLKTGELKIIKGMGKSFAYNSIGLLKTLLERDYSVALEDSIVHITSYINDIEQENKRLKEKINTYENPEDLTLMFMYCDEKAKDKIKQLKEDLTKEELAYSNLRDTYNKKYDECKLYKEIIEEVRTLHKNFCTKHGIIVFENNELIEFMNNLIDTLNKAKDNK